LAVVEPQRLQQRELTQLHRAAERKAACGERGFDEAGGWQDRGAQHAVIVEVRHAVGAQHLFELHHVSLRRAQPHTEQRMAAVAPAGRRCGPRGEPQRLALERVGR
jgi:hypothetical protein